MKSLMQICYEDFMANGDGQIRIVRDDGNVSIDSPRRWFDPGYELTDVDKSCLLEIGEGTILDIACGTGVHMRYLQRRGREVYGVDISSFSIDLAKKMGTKNVYAASFWDFDIGMKFDNAICMNGSIGFVGNLEGVRRFLVKAHGLLNDGGCLYLQGVDWRIDYTGKHSKYIQRNKERGIYPGIVRLHQEYGDVVEDEFEWIWVDVETLEILAREAGFAMIRLKWHRGKYFMILKKTE